MTLRTCRKLFASRRPLLRRSHGTPPPPQVYENEYDLFLGTDLNDRSECGNLCQWFYFGVCGMQPGVAYKFNLVNLKKVRGRLKGAQAEGGSGCDLGGRD